jgi:hypothetical protein
MIIFVVPLMWYDGKRQQRRQQGKSSLRVGSKPVSKTFVGEDIGNLLLRFQATGRSAWEDTSMPKKRSLLASAFALYYDNNVEGTALGLEVISKQRSWELTGSC